MTRDANGLVRFADLLNPQLNGLREECIFPTNAHYETRSEVLMQEGAEAKVAINLAMPKPPEIRRSQSMMGPPVVLHLIAEA